MTNAEPPFELRADRSSAGVVTLRASAWHWLDIWRVALAPLVLAPIAIAVHRDLGAVSEIALALGVLVGAYTIWRLTRIRDGFAAVISDSEVSVKRRLRKRSVPRSSIDTLYVVAVESNGGWTMRWSLISALTSGEKRELVWTDDRRLALALKRELERELGLVLQAVPGAVDRLPSVARFPFVQLAVSIAFFAVATWLLLTVEKPLAEVETGDEPSTTSFTLAEPSTLALKSEIHYADSIRAPLPRAFVYDISVSKDGQPVARFTCDPHAAKTMSWTMGSGQNIRAFMTVLEGCTKPLERSGSYTLTARRVWRLDRTSVQVASSKVLVYAE